MKKRITILMTILLLTTSVLSGCGAQNTITEQIETVETAATEDSTSEQTEEATVPTEETAEPTSEATEETSEEVVIETETTKATPETTIELTETVDPEQTETPSPELKAEYTYTEMSATMYAQQTVNVRDLPDTDGNKLGGLSTNDEIIVTGQCNETSWYRFEYNGAVAYVSNKYVGENKVEVQQVPTDNSGGQASIIATTECPYPMLQVIDEGGDKVYYYYTPSTQNRNIYNECASIIASRHGWYTDFVNGGTAGSGGAGEPEKTNYTYNGEVVYRARPCTYLIGPNGGGPANALEVVICP